MARHFRRLTCVFAGVLLLAPLCSTPRLGASPKFARPAGELQQLLIELHTTGRLMHTVAHPDDEDGGMLVLEARGEGITTLQLTLNRGEGGQNRMGSNLFDELGVLRTLELLAADEYYGVRQRFTRVADFGYSKTAKETFDKWHGHDVALADMVRVIRTFRPDVIVTRFQGNERDGHGNHQADGILTREAFRAAADPGRFPEQIERGLQPWQAKKLYVRGSEDYTLALDTGANSPLLGTSFQQFAMQGLRHQLSQGAGEWRLSSRPHVSYYKLVDSVVGEPPEEKHERDFFDGLDTSLPGLADRVDDSQAPFLRPALIEIQKQVDEATHLIPGSASRLSAPLLAGLHDTEQLMDQVEHSELSPAAKAELLTNLETKRQQFERAANLALHLDFRVTFNPPSASGMVVPGQAVRLVAELRNTGDEAVQVQQVGLELPPGWTTTPVWLKAARLKAGETVTIPFTVTVTPNAELTRPYWHRDNPETDAVYKIDDARYETLPFPPPPVRAHANYAFGGRRGTLRAVVRASNSENSPPLAVVPAFSVLIAPRTQVVRANSGLATTVTVQVRGYVAANANLRLLVPQQWHAEPESANLRFERSGEEKRVTFKVSPHDNYPPGKFRVEAVLQAAGREYSEGFSIVTGEDLGTFYYYQAAAQQLSVVDVEVASGLKIGYIMGAGDDIPTVLKELGLNVDLLSPDEVAHRDLAQFDTIILGIRAYDTRADVRQNNQRLMSYVLRGGTLLVQYNTNPEDFNTGHFLPYPAQLSHVRVSDEDAPVTLLEPYDHIFRFPNLIGEADFKDWVQERGLYFMEQWDSHYRPLLACADPGEPPREGGLLRARYGRGVYIYTGYAFFRQLPNGVPGATRFYVNLLSAGHGRP